MKPVLFSAAALLVLSATAAQAQRVRIPSSTPGPQLTDTIVVRLPNKAVMTLMVHDAKQLRELPKYHLDSLVARLDTYIQRADEAAKTAKTDRVTLEFFPNQDAPGQGLPEEVRITTRKSQGKPKSTRVDVALDKVFGLRMELDADGKKTYVMGKQLEGTPESRAARRDSLENIKQERRSGKTRLVLDLGLNALANRGSGAPELRTLGSRYVNIGFNTAARLGGKQSPAYVVFGPEFAFNNYMLEGNNKWVNQNGQTSVVPETNGRQYQKTKLATSTFTVPLMLQFKFREKDARTGRSRDGFTIGAGGFAGYRLGSWTKLKYFEEGNTYKDKNYGSYNLNDWQYGLQGVIGYRSHALFVKYNLNELFREGQGPKAQTISFGIRFFGD
jgi:hypothetical protein